MIETHIILKRCSTCRIEKSLDHFHKDKSRKSGYDNQCKICKNNRQKISHYIHRESRLKRQKIYDANNKEKKRQYLDLHADRIRQRRHLYYLKNKSKIMEYQKSKIQSNSFLSFKEQIRNAVRRAIGNKGYTKKSKTFILVGCSYKELLIYLGTRPEGDIHIDHICPVSQAQNENEIVKLQHYTNLRYLSAKENLKKRDKKTTEAEAVCSQLLGREWIDKENNK